MPNCRPLLRCKNLQKCVWSSQTTDYRPRQSPNVTLWVTSASHTSSCSHRHPQSAALASVTLTTTAVYSLHQRTTGLVCDSLSTVYSLHHQRTTGLACYSLSTPEDYGTSLLQLVYTTADHVTIPVTHSWEFKEVVRCFII